MAGYAALESVSPDERARLMDIERQVIDMRLKGVSFRQIGRKLGITHVYRVWERAMARTDNGDARSKYALQQEHDRLDTMQASIWEAAQAGDLDAIRTIERLMQRRARLAGLDHQDRTSDKMVEIERAKLVVLGQALMQAVERVDLSPAQRSAILAEWRAQAQVLDTGMVPVPTSGGGSLELESGSGHSDTPEASEAPGDTLTNEDIEWDLL